MSAIIIIIIIIIFVLLKKRLRYMSMVLKVYEYISREVTKPPVCASDSKNEPSTNFLP